MNTQTQRKRGAVNAYVYPYILNQITTEGYDVLANSDAEKLQFLANTFKKEASYYIKTCGQVRGMAEWLMGLPSCFNIDFENYRILEIAREWQSLSANSTEKEEQKILDTWFNFIAHKTFQLFKKYKIDY